MNEATQTADALPLVSIVVPVYNGEAYLSESLTSLIEQTYPHVEILVMDDASTDSTADIIESFAGRVTHYRNLTNLGQFANVNEGIRKAKGEFVCVYHADDVYHPEIVEQEARYLMAHASAGAVFCLDLFMDANGRIYNQLSLPAAVRGGGPFNYETILNALLTYKNAFLVGPSSMVRRSVYRDTGLYNGEKYGIAGDLEMWLRIARSHDIGIIEKHLMSYRHDHGNLSQNYYRMRTEPEIHFRILQEHLDAGAVSLATDDALKAHQAHWTEDQLMVAINFYIKGDMEACKAQMAQVRPAHLLGSSQVQRQRLLVLYGILMVICRVPQIGYLAGVFDRRWHGQKSTGG